MSFRSRLTCTKRAELSQILSNIIILFTFNRTWEAIRDILPAERAGGQVAFLAGQTLGTEIAKDIGAGRVTGWTGSSRHTKH